MILSFDTSNYTTSVALIGLDGTIESDRRILLAVREGERGLRQSDALFQHGKNLPVLLSQAADDVAEKGTLSSLVEGIAVSVSPRSQEGSYMPCFLAGEELASSLSNVLKVPVYEFSHQEGHMAAASYKTPLENETKYLAWHLSGGTCELLYWDTLWSTPEIIGGSKDISFGQVLDRMGVAMGYPFPAGKYIDEDAMTAEKRLIEPSMAFRNPLTKVKVKGADFNLSGLETQILKQIAEEGIQSPDKPQKGAVWNLCSFALERIAETIATATRNASEATGLNNVLFAGGVSSSAYLRMKLKEDLNDLNIAFGEPALSADNAVGIGLLGRKEHLK